MGIILHTIIVHDTGVVVAGVLYKRGNFRENLIFAVFANDLKTRKYVSAKNCTLKESLEVGTDMIFCCIPYLI